MPDKGFNLVTHLETCAQVHNEALAHLLCYTQTEYTQSMFGSVVAISPRTTETVSNNCYDAASSLPPQRTHRPDRPLLFSSSPTSSAFNRSYHSTIYTYPLRLSQMQRVSLTSRYVFGTITPCYCSPLTFTAGSIPRVSPVTQGVAPLAPPKTWREGP